jgi:pimeloyl-ACP methyl ester carboxylesterase
VNNPNASVAPLLMSDSGIAFRHQQGNDPKLTPLILLHGLSQQADFWQPVVESLGSEYDILSIDLRGHGQSRDMDHEYQISRVSEDCISLMNERGIGAACVIGHSWGASVALHIAAEYPERTTSCVLVDGGAFTPANILARGGISREDLRTALTPPHGPFTRSELAAHYLPEGPHLNTRERAGILAAVDRTYVDFPRGELVTTIGFERHMSVLEDFFDYNPDSDLDRLVVTTWILIALEQQTTGEVDGDTHLMDDWGRAKFEVDLKVRGKMNIALQHWYGAAHDVPLYWPDRVAGLISHAATTGRIFGKGQLT